MLTKAKVEYINVLALYHMTSGNRPPQISVSSMQFAIHIAHPLEGHFVAVNNAVVVTAERISTSRVRQPGDVLLQSITGTRPACRVPANYATLSVQ